MNVSRINSAQNINFNGRFLTTAANHLKNNCGHYACNVGAYTGAALFGNLNSAEGIIAVKLLSDTIETIGRYFFKRGNIKGYASIENPLTNTVFWLFKGECKLFEKFISKVK